MSDPQTTNVGFYAPTRGSDSGTWDLPVNANASALDAMFSNIVTLTLTNANVTLTSPPNSGASWSGPYQSQSGIIKLTGALSGNVTITFPRAGFWMVDNQCTNQGAFYVKLAASTPGNVIGCPPVPIHIYSDGVNIVWVNPPMAGTAIDLQGWTTYPPWMGVSANTVLPFLIKDGSTYSTTTYARLFAQLGSTFGGNGVTTFGVPDEMARCRFGLDTVGTSRLTPSVSINGTVMGSAGGDENFQSHNHGVTDPGHIHGFSGVQLINAGSAGSSNSLASTLSRNTNSNTTGISINSNGAGSWGNVPPGYVAHLPLIKT